MTRAAVACGLLLCLWLAWQPADARERVHYIAADEVLWNYAPQHRDVIANTPLPPEDPAQLGWTYRKAVYREYTDATFSRLLRTASWKTYMGLVGPAIHAEVGDTVVVIFRNHTNLPVDIAPAGLASTPAAAAVRPGETRTYSWRIRDDEGPSSQDSSSVLYVYGSDVRERVDEDAGLIGPLIVTRRGQARADGSPSDVDREIVVLYSLQEESLSPLLATNLSDAVVNPRHVARTAKGFNDANEFSTLNGFTYGSMPTPVMRSGERVRWYLLSTNNALDFHAPTWDGQTLLWHGNRVDAMTLTHPHEVVDMVPDVPGVWLLTCSFNAHQIFGMKAHYRVVP